MRALLLFIRRSLCTCGPLLLSLTPHAQDSLNVHFLGRWHDDALPPTDQYDNTYNAVWGYAADGHEYGIIGSTMGTHIIEVTDPVVPVEVAFIPGAFQGTDVVHREYKTYADRLYAVTDEGPGTLQIIDLRFLPDSAPVNYDSDALFTRAHTLWIDTANARLYTHAGSTPFAVYSLADPDAPTLLIDAANDIPWWNSVGWVHDAFTVNNICYTNDMNAMHIIDFSSIASPQLLGTLTAYPQPGYNHSGWLHDNGWLYCMADETHGTDLKLLDVSDPTDIQFVDTIGVEWNVNSIAHNPAFQGDLLHVSYYYDGYWLWNCADPFNATVIGYYDTSLEPHSLSYKGAWGVYPFLPSGVVLVSDMQRGLFVLDIAQALDLGSAASGPLVRVWPSLTDGPVNVAAPAGSRIEVFNAGGQRIHPSRAPDGGAFDLSGLAGGVYVFHVTSDQATTARRVVKATR